MDTFAPRLFRIDGGIEGLSVRGLIIDKVSMFPADALDGYDNGYGEWSMPMAEFLQKQSAIRFPPLRIGRYIQLDLFSEGDKSIRVFVDGRTIR
jgi:hypothetical protein